MKNQQRIQRTEEKLKQEFEQRKEKKLLGLQRHYEEVSKKAKRLTEEAHHLAELYNKVKREEFTSPIPKESDRRDQSQRDKSKRQPTSPQKTEEMKVF